MGKKIDWLKVAIGGLLMLPIGPEDVATGGVGILPSAAVGLGLVLDGFGVV